jgi:hypothetical protein
MSWEADLELVINRTKHERYRQLCADDHPDHEIWRARMIEKAKQPWIIEHSITPKIIEPDGTKRDSSHEEIEQIRAARIAGDIARRAVPAMTWGQKAAGFLGAAGRAVQAGWNGRPVLAPKDEIEARMNLCKACEHLKGHRCGICSCFVVAKTQLAGEQCPLIPPKWARVEFPEPEIKLVPASVTGTSQGKPCCG